VQSPAAAVRVAAAINALMRGAGKALDAADRLAACRRRLACIDGNSLGPVSKATAVRVQDVILRQTGGGLDELANLSGEIAGHP
jgi:hypothetical protein